MADAEPASSVTAVGDASLTMMRLHNPSHVAIVFTSAGGTYVPATLACVRNMSEPEVRITGVDRQESIDSASLFDKFTSLHGNDEAAIGENLLRICQETCADVIFPGSEGECLAISALRDQFNDAAVLIPMPDRDMVKMMASKAAFCNLLREQHLDSVEFVLATGMDELLRVMEHFGYPRRGVVIKPQAGSGSKGTFIVVDTPPSPPIRNAERRYAICTRSEFIQLSEAWNLNFEDQLSLVMPYYEGPVYDVDCLALEHKPIYVIPRERRYRDPLSPISQGCVVSYNQKVVDLIERIIQELELDYLFDFDVAVGSDGAAHIIDVSPRMSGSVAASSIAGANIPGAVVRYRAGMTVPTPRAVEGTYLMPFPSFFPASSKANE